MTDKERLIDLIKQAEKEFSDTGKPILEIEEFVADHLLANGVTISKPKTIRPPADLKGKCGGCIYSKPYEGESRTFKSYVECTNEEHMKKYCYRKNSKYRQRTARACKCYQERVDEG